MAKVTEPGRWYFTVKCLACGGPIPLAEAPSPAELPDPLKYRIVTDVMCPHCGQTDVYGPSQISRRPTL